MKAACGCGSAAEGFAKDVLAWMMIHPCTVDHLGDQVDSSADTQIRIGFQPNDLEEDSEVM